MQEDTGSCHLKPKTRNNIIEVVLSAGPTHQGLQRWVAIHKQYDVALGKAMLD